MQAAVDYKLLLTSPLNVLRIACILPFIIAAACTPVKNENNLSILEQKNIQIVDEEIDSSLNKAMESYRKYLEQNPDANKTAEAMRRPEGLEATNSYNIPGPDSPVEAGAHAAIKHYTQLLADYPMHDYSDHVLYQLSRAYKEVGNNKKAVTSLQQLAARYPEYEHIDEVNFRLGEYYFSKKLYEQANSAYTAVLAFGKSSVFYSAALDKQGWSFFKQDNYKQALSYFIASLDQVVEQGYVPGNTDSQAKIKTPEDIYRAISLTFAYMDGANAIAIHTEEKGKKLYEAELYHYLAEYYLSKQRYSDAAGTYQKYIRTYPYAKNSPHYAVKIIEIYQQGNFNDLAIKARIQFAGSYDKRTDNWKKLGPDLQKEINIIQKENIYTLASLFHKRYRKTHKQKDKQHYYTQAIHWYNEYNYLYPQDQRTPEMSKRLAELHLENKDYRKAALAFERTAYNFPSSEVAVESGYAAIFAYREHLKSQAASKHNRIREEVVRNSLQFVGSFPHHPEAAAVLATAANDQLILKNYTAAINSARRVVTKYKSTDKKQLRSAWLVLADASFESANYEEAEKAYQRAISMTANDDKNRTTLVNNLAASIYKQGEQARMQGMHNIAANHFLRIQTVTPTAILDKSVQNDAVIELVAAKNWIQAASVLEDFRKQYPDHEMTDASSRNLAVIYRKNGELLKSAAEFERIEKNNKNKAIRRDALLQAAELYQQTNKTSDALRVYKRYVQLFPSPAADAIESYQHIADIYKSGNDTNNFHAYLKEIVTADDNAGNERTERTRQLASQAMLTLAEEEMDAFKKVELIKPFKKNLALKKKRMAATVELLNRLLKYQISGATTAATFYIAEIYLQFSQALASSERPSGLKTAELEQYELALEEQIYEFEEKSIDIHEKNTELLDAGIYDPWVTKSINRLTELLPARYSKQEQYSGYLQTPFARDDRI